MRPWRPFASHLRAILTACVALAGSTSACGGSGGGGNPVDPPEPVARVEVTPPSDTILVKSSVALAAQTFDAQDEELTGRVVAWSVSNPAMASVSSTGLVTALALGTVTVTATAEGHSDEAVLTLVPKIVIGRRFPSLFVGDTTLLVASLMDANDDPLPAAPVAWGTGNPGIATVSGGVVTGHGPGTATISATILGQQASELVVVLEPRSGQTREVAYLADAAGEICTMELWVSTPDGLDQARLSPVGQYVQDFEWNPDGSRLALEYITCNGAGNSGIHRVDADGGNLLPVVAAGRNPSWSPDGQLIAYSRPGNDIARVGVDGTGDVGLSVGAGDDVLPAWSPDGRQIAFLRATAGCYDLWIMDAAGGENRRKIVLPHLVCAFQWSPDGKQIAYLTGSALWVVNADGSNPRELAGPADRFHWSPDGQAIFRGWGNTAWLHDPWFGAGMPVAVDPTCCAEPPTPLGFSPGGDLLLFSGRRPAPEPAWPSIGVAGPDGSGPSLFTNGSNVWAATWRP